MDTTTIPTLLRLFQAERLAPSALFTHSKCLTPTNQLFRRLELTAFLDFPFSEISEAYRKFNDEKATLKVIVDF